MFSGSTYDFTVYIKADRKFAGIARKTFGWEIVKDTADFSKNVHPASSDFFKLGKEQVYLVAKIEAVLDEDSARLHAERFLNVIQSMCYMAPSGIRPQVVKDMYVVRGKQQAGIRSFAPKVPLSRRQTVPSSVAADEIHRTTEAVMGKFARQSRFRLIRSLNTYALAHRSPDPENQLISVWAAIEVLLSDPPNDTPRIKHYESLLVPCICYRYLWRHFEILFRGLRQEFRSSLEELLRNEQVGDSMHEKLAAILVLEGRDHSRAALCKLCARNPLALHRLWYLHENLKTPALIVKFLQAHERRVSWQIQRIYRVRNTLVHSGTKPPFLETATMNLDEYFRVTWAALLDWPVAAGVETTVDQLVTNIGLNHDLHKAMLARNREAASVMEGSMYRYFGRREV